MFVDKIFSRINKLSNHPYLYITPNVYAIGDCSQSILYGVISARSQNKKLFFLYPYDLSFIFKWKLTNRELFLLESEYIKKQGYFTLLLTRLLVTIVYIPIRTYALIARDFFKKHVDESILTPMIGSKEIFIPCHVDCDFNYYIVKKYLSKWWFNQNVIDFKIRKFDLFNNNGLSNLKKSLGMLEDDWYVCLHVRENGFRGDVGRREYRNSNIYNYIKAIKEITSRGGWVVRMGDNTMQRLPKMEKVVDYPFSKYKSDLNDILLIKDCYFYLGAQSGILDVANLFSKNILIVNMVQWSSGLKGVNSRGILKHWYSKKKKMYISFEQLFKNRIGFVTEEHAIWTNDNEAVKWKEAHESSVSIDDYILFENNEDEIKDAVVEYLDNLDGNNFHPSSLQLLFSMYRQECIADMLFGPDIYMFNSNNINLINNYYFALEVESANGFISNSFLSKNWKHNMRNKD